MALLYVTVASYIRGLRMKYGIIQKNDTGSLSNEVRAIPRWAVNQATFGVEVVAHKIYHPEISTWSYICLRIGIALDMYRISWLVDS